MLTERRKTHSFGRKIDSDQCGNVCRRERVAGDKGYFRQTPIEIGIEVLHPKLASVGQRGNLIIIVGSSNRASFEPFRRVACVYRKPYSSDDVMESPKLAE